MEQVKTFWRSVILDETAQDVTAAWVDFGSEASVKVGENSVVIAVSIDANDSTDIRFRLLKQFASSGATWFSSTIDTVAADRIKFREQMWEYDVDGADADVCVEFNIKGASAIKLQIQCGVVGGTAGQLDAAYATFITSTE